MKISGCVDASTALEMATVADNREQYYGLTFTCSGCGWKVNLHRTNPPHFEHHASNPKLCVLPH